MNPPVAVTIPETLAFLPTVTSVLIATFIVSRLIVVAAPIVGVPPDVLSNLVAVTTPETEILDGNLEFVKVPREIFEASNPVKLVLQRKMMQSQHQKH